MNLTGAGPLCSCDCCSVAQRRADERKNQMGRAVRSAVGPGGLLRVVGVGSQEVPCLVNTQKAIDNCHRNS